MTHPRRAHSHKARTEPHGVGKTTHGGAAHKVNGRRSRPVWPAAPPMVGGAAHEVGQAAHEQPNGVGGAARFRRRSQQSHSRGRRSCPMGSAEPQDVGGADHGIDLPRGCATAPRTPKPMRQRVRSAPALRHRGTREGLAGPRSAGQPEVVIFHEVARPTRDLRSGRSVIVGAGNACDHLFLRWLGAPRGWGHDRTSGDLQRARGALLLASELLQPLVTVDVLLEPDRNCGFASRVRRSRRCATNTKDDIEP